MDFIGGLLTTRKGHDYLVVVVDIFDKMCVIMKGPSKDKNKQTCYLKMFGCTMGYDGSSSHIEIPYFSVYFGLHFGKI